MFTELEVNFFLLRRLLGVRTSGEEKQARTWWWWCVRGGCGGWEGPAARPSAPRDPSPACRPRQPRCPSPLLPPPACPPARRLVLSPPLPLQGKVSKLSKNEVLMLNIGSMCTGARVVAVRGARRGKDGAGGRLAALFSCRRRHRQQGRRPGLDQACARPPPAHRPRGPLPPFSPGQARPGQAAAHQPRVHQGGREDRAEPSRGEALAAHRLGPDSEGAAHGAAGTQRLRAAASSPPRAPLPRSPCLFALLSPAAAPPSLGWLRCDTSREKRGVGRGMPGDRCKDEVGGRQRQRAHPRASLAASPLLASSSSLSQHPQTTYDEQGRSYCHHHP